MKILIAILSVLTIVYLLVWPVAIDPKPWRPPLDAGYKGAHAKNDLLATIERLSIAPYNGPEDIAAGPDGTLYTVSAEGSVLSIKPDGSYEVLFRAGGRPLGIERTDDGAVIIANATLGLQRVSANKTIGVLTKSVANSPLLFANNLAIAGNGTIFFSDSTRHFGAKKYGNMKASLLDLMEHDPTGRVLVYDPATETTEVLIDKLSFANGVALDPEERYLLVAETGEYRIWRYWLTGAKRGRKEIIVDNLPGFPDNINTGLDGRFWVGLVSPRSAQLDSMAASPMMRKIVQRWPAALRPAAGEYAHVIAIDGDGNVLHDLQGDGSGIKTTTGVLETETDLYIASLTDWFIGRLPKSAIGL